MKYKKDDICMYTNQPLLFCMKLKNSYKLTAKTGKEKSCSFLQINTLFLKERLTGENINTRIALCIIMLPLLLFNNSKSAAQDAHLSQFFASPIILNPSLTGMQDHGDIRVATQYRNQWNTITNKLSTTTMAADMPIQDRFGIGGYIMTYDAAKSFNVFTMVVGGAYDIASRHQKKHKITTGLQLGIINKSTSNDQLVFDNQYVDGTFNTDLPHGEVMPKMNKLMPEVNYGISYISIDHKKKIKPYGGFTLYHITHPRESFLSDKTSRLPLRYLLQGGTKVLISDEFVIDVKALYMQQRNAREINAGIEGGYILQPNTFSLLGGVFYRHKDAIIPMIGLDYKSVTLRMSYDVNISSLKEFSRSKGGMEFSLIFVGGKQHHSFKM